MLPRYLTWHKSNSSALSLLFATSSSRREHPRLRSLSNTSYSTPLAGYPKAGQNSGSRLPDERARAELLLGEYMSLEG
jgi:hypothetical protein